MLRFDGENITRTCREFTRRGTHKDVAGSTRGAPLAYFNAPAAIGTVQLPLPIFLHLNILATASFIETCQHGCDLRHVSIMINFRLLHLFRRGTICFEFFLGTSARTIEGFGARGCDIRVNSGCKEILALYKKIPYISS